MLAGMLVDVPSFLGALWGPWQFAFLTVGEALLWIYSKWIRPRLERQRYAGLPVKAIKPLSPAWFLGYAGVCVLAAAFFAWREQYTIANEVTAPRLAIEIEDLELGHDERSMRSGAVLVAKIENIGSGPSNCRQFTAEWVTARGHHYDLGEPQFIPEGVLVAIPGRPRAMRFETADDLVSKTRAGPIEEGEIRVGVLQFRIDDRWREEFGQPGIEVTLHCMDMRGNDVAASKVTGGEPPDTFPRISGTNTTIEDRRVTRGENAEANDP